MNLHASKALLVLSRKETNARKRIRLLAVSLFLSGENRTNIAKRLNVARSSVNLWVTQYLAHGEAGLNNKPISGRPQKLTQVQLEQLHQYISLSATSTDGGRLIGADIDNYIFKHFNVRYNSGHVYKIIKKLGFSWITTRSKHPKQSQEAQDAFKKVSFGNDLSHTF